MKNSNYFFGCLFLICPCFSLQAQEIELKGKITAEIEETAFVNIINLTQKTGSISNKDGEFTSFVQLNDTLIFSAVQFEKLEVVINEEILQKEDLAIHLIEKNTFLQEVVINPYGLTGNLEKDAQNMPSYAFDYKAAGLIPPRKPLTQNQRRLYTASSTTLDYIINSINGRIKQLRKIEEWDRLDALKEDIRERLPKDFFIDELGLEEKYIPDFLYFSLEDKSLHNYVYKNKDLEIINYLMLKADAYKILKENENTTDR